MLCDDLKYESRVPDDLWCSSTSTALVTQKRCPGIGTVRIQAYRLGGDGRARCREALGSERETLGSITSTILVTKKRCQDTGAARIQAYRLGGDSRPRCREALGSEREAVQIGRAHV